MGFFYQSERSDGFHTYFSDGFGFVFVCLTDGSFIERMTAGDETSRQTEIYELHGNFPSKSCWHMTHEAPPFQVAETDPDE